MIESPAPPRNALLAGQEMVGALHPAVSAVGAQILATGGNAIDATVAMAAMSWLALPGQCGVGGDAFAIIHEPGGAVRTVGASGFGPDGTDVDFFRARGLPSIPLSGALAVAAPGSIAALHALHNLGATRSLAELWAPAIQAAENGVACSAKTRENILDYETELRVDADMRQIFLRNGRAPQLGQRLVQPELAGSMRRLAADPRSMYEGELADRALEALQAEGAPFSGEEWALSGEAAVADAVTATYGGLLVHETPPPTPGWMLLQQAGLCDGQLTALPWLGADAIGWLAEAARRAFHDRRQGCGADNDAWCSTLDPGALEAARQQIRDGQHTLVDAGVRPDGDTTSTVAVDSAGRAVSFIQSLAFTFGARFSVPGTGIVLNNRLGRGAYLTEGHPNAVKPRRRPLHTLNAWIATDDKGHLRHVGNTPGGDGQVQWNMQLLYHLIDHGLDPQEAVSAPRFTVFPGSDADTIGHDPELRCESRIPDSTLDRLREHGNGVKRIGPWSAGGGALVISIDHELGCLSGAADPRQDGVVLGV